VGWPVLPWWLRTTGSGSTPTLPFFMQLKIDEAIGQSDSNLIMLLVVGFGLVYAINILVKALRSWVVLTLG